MSRDDTIIASVIFERNSIARSSGFDRIDTNEARKIERYGRKMIRFAESGRIRPTDSNEDIAKSLSSGVLVWLFWQIAPELRITDGKAEVSLRGLPDPDFISAKCFQDHAIVSLSLTNVRVNY